MGRIRLDDCPLLMRYTMDTALAQMKANIGREKESLNARVFFIPRRPPARISKLRYEQLSTMEAYRANSPYCGGYDDCSQNRKFFGTVFFT
jgi:hypothetical protein